MGVAEIVLNAYAFGHDSENGSVLPEFVVDGVAELAGKGLES